MLHPSCLCEIGAICQSAFGPGLRSLSLIRLSMPDMIRRPWVLHNGNILSVPDVSRERRCLQTSPEQLMATKDKNDQKKSEFPSPGGSGVSRELGQILKHCKKLNLNTGNPHLGI